MLFDSLRPARPRPPALAHGAVVEVEGRPVRLKVHPRARRISLRLDRARREIVATAPSQRRLADAVAFARTRAGWIAEVLDRLPEPQALAPGRVLMVWGQPCRLERAAMRIAPRIIPPREGEAARLLAHGEGETYARAAIRALKAEALRRLTDRTAVHAAALGVAMPTVAVMDARSRWGSCTPPAKDDAGRVRYVWRLALAPPEVADYVAAHEAAHLLEANHGPRFWALVRRLYGDPAPARAWLRRHGGRLHALG